MHVCTCACMHYVHMHVCGVYLWYVCMYVRTYVGMHVLYVRVLCNRWLCPWYMYMYACMCERMCLMGSDDIDRRPACVLLNVSCFSRDSIAQPFWYIVRTLMHEVASYNLVEGFCADALIA